MNKTSGISLFEASARLHRAGTACLRPPKPHGQPRGHVRSTERTATMLTLGVVCGLTTATVIMVAALAGGL